jgi:vanillate O-demethylase ferredoxin subunit
MTASRLRVRVADKATEALDICSLKLVAADAGVLPAFLAGSHIDVDLPNGCTRQYSLCNSPAASDHYLISVLREPMSRGGSQVVHGAVAKGDILAISAPKNHFSLAEEASHSLLLAGGIGVTPILCMAESLSLAKSSFEMHYCTRSRARAAFHDRIMAASYRDCVQFHYDDGPATQKLNIGALLSAPVSGTHLYVCGPKGFMDAVLQCAFSSGWSSDSIHYEFFSATPSSADEQSGFHVRLASSGKLIFVPSDKTITEALSEAGVTITTSCEQGVCGTCLTRVIEGIPDHRDMYLTPEERARNDQLTPCCSRAKSSLLVLDI